MPALLDDHFFRREAARLTAALARVFGLHNLALVEDAVQDALGRALEVWKVRGIPDQPSAWLMATAKNRALDMLRREQRGQHVRAQLDREHELPAPLEPLGDEQLRMMFSCCHPQLAEEAQVALMLNVLCGFAAHEIGSALLSSTAAIEKRIARGKQVLAQARTLFALDDADFSARLGSVRRALYLLFNEGYHGASSEAVRAELCEEAVRLTVMLAQYPAAATPTTDALAALMCLHAARLPARVDAAGELSALVDQDRTRWDQRLLDAGLSLLERSATGVELSAYHLEAAIAVAHVSAATLAETNWDTIVALYDRLFALEPTPVVALNRAIAVGQRDGPVNGLRALHAIGDLERLANYPFYPAACAELELRRGDLAAARAHFQTALQHARNDAERVFLNKRLLNCG